MFSEEVVAKKSLENSLKTGKLSHAYLFISEDKNYSDSFILQFVKAIFCLNNGDKHFYSCNSCVNCKNITNDNYVDFYKIDNEGATIKKEDVLFLKEELKVKAFYDKKIYWIKDVDNFTPQAANSLLKFLEEPEENIIAILSCSNVSTVLPTILSRCQQIKLVGSLQDNENILEEDQTLLKEFVKKFIKNKHLATIYLLGTLTAKEDIVKFLENTNKNLQKSYSISINSSNIARVQEKLLAALLDIKSNVSATLALEKFIFTIILENDDLSFLEEVM